MSFRLLPGLLVSVECVCTTWKMQCLVHLKYSRSSSLLDSHPTIQHKKDNLFSLFSLLLMSHSPFLSFYMRFKHFAIHFDHNSHNNHFSSLVTFLHLHFIVLLIVEIVELLCYALCMVEVMLCNVSTLNQYGIPQWEKRIAAMSSRKRVENVLWKYFLQIFCLTWDNVLRLYVFFKCN